MLTWFYIFSKNLVSVFLGQNFGLSNCTTAKFSQISKIVPVPKNLWIIRSPSEKEVFEPTELNGLEFPFNGISCIASDEISLMNLLSG